MENQLKPVLQLVSFSELHPFEKMELQRHDEFLRGIEIIENLQSYNIDSLQLISVLLRNGAYIIHFDIVFDLTNLYLAGLIFISESMRKYIYIAFWSPTRLPVLLQLAKSPGPSFYAFDMTIFFSFSSRKH